MASSLAECYASIKEMLQLYVESCDFLVAANLYKLLAEVACHSHDFARAIKYYAQAVC